VLNTDSCQFEHELAAPLDSCQPADSYAIREWS